MSYRPPFEGSGSNKVSRALGNAASSLGSFNNNLTNLAGTLSNTLGGATPPTVSGLGTRQSQVPPNRDGKSKRQVLRWLVPEQPLVEMYINPQKIDISYKKSTKTQRTKGGFVGQYWGEELIEVNIGGTTGTSGIEGINVLLDVYRNEQLMFDPYALFLQAERERAEQINFDSLLSGSGTSGFGGTILGAISALQTSPLEGALTSRIVNSRNRPSLANMAFTVEMYWSGEVYRGFFDNFTVTETAENIGLFDYNIKFIATQKRGFRTNFFAWHKHPSYGQSNSDNNGLPPHSFTRLSHGPLTTAQTPRDPNVFEAIAEGINKIKNNMSRDTRETLDAFSLP